MEPSIISDCLEMPKVFTTRALPQTVVDSPTYLSTDNAVDYHEHLLPAQDGFGSLLTAVNIPASIVAPKPRGCHEQVVSYLDDQAIAAEQLGLRFPSYIDTLRIKEGNRVSHAGTFSAEDRLDIESAKGTAKMPGGITSPHPAEKKDSQPSIRIGDDCMSKEELT